MALMAYTAMPGLVEAATHFWDYKRAVFHFNGLELAPVLKEFGGLAGLESGPETMIYPRDVDPKEFIELLHAPYDPYLEGVHDGKVNLEYLYCRF